MEVVSSQQVLYLDKADELTWKSDRIPGTLRQLFNSSMAPAWRIVQPYCVGLAPQLNSSLEPLWYVGCKVMTGEDKLCKSVDPAHMNIQRVKTRFLCTYILYVLLYVF